MADSRKALMNWSLYQKEFQVTNGSLRDIYVHDTTIGDWRSTWAWLRSKGYQLSYSVDGQARELPEDPQEALSLRKTAATLLSIHIGSVQVNCHFFGVDDIEMDIDPQQVTSDETLEALFSFLLGLSGVLNKRVDLTDEGDPDRVIFVALPGADGVSYVL